MPKSAKKKASADFTKTKAKLGKGKQLANNATDTSFKSRTIALPQQSINSIHSSSNSNPTNFRNETLDDLLVQTRHYNAAKRKDGILAIKSLLIQYPHLTTSTLNFVLPSLIRLIPDEEPIVRKTQQSFLSWYFEVLPTSSLIPYQNSMILFTTSAMSHIFNHVRLDAVKILDILLKFCPEAFRDLDGEEEILSSDKLFGGSSNQTGSSSTTTINKEENSSNTEKVLKCYLNLLGIEYDSNLLNKNGKEKSKNGFGTASTASTDLSSTSKLLLLRSFTSFLKVISNQTISRGNEDPTTTSQNQGSSTSCPTWFFKNSFKSNDSEFEIFKNFFKSNNNNHDSSSNFENGSTYSFLDPSDSIQNHHQHAGGENDSNMMDIESKGFEKSLAVNDLNKELRNLDSLMDFGFEDPSGSNHHSNPSSHHESGYSVLSTLLHPLLLTTHLDSFPNSSLSQSSTFTSTSSDRGNSTPLDIESELISSILQLSLILWRGISKSISSSSSSSFDSSTSSNKISKSQLTNQSNLLLRMFPLFPFGSKNPNLILENLSVKSRDTLKEMNLNYCELIALVSFLSRKNQSSDDDDDDEGNQENSKVDLDHQLLKVGEYLISILDESSNNQNNLLGSSQTIGIETYRNLLPIIWLLLNNKNKVLSSSDDDGNGISGFKHSFSFGYDDQQKKSGGKKGKGKGKNQETEADLPMDFKILQALLNHYDKLTTSNKTKVLAFEFIARLSILHTYPGYRSSFNIKPSSPLRKNFSNWFRSLPKYLWELGPKDPSTSEKVLRFLKEIVGRSDGRIFNAEDINQLTQSLAPFFHISHPSRGEIKGPYSKLPLKVQTRAQGLVYFLLDPQVEEDDSNEESETEAEKKLRASVKKAGIELVE